ncbi:hypothetical protein HMPREF0880_01972 [Yokenella regensburgei ATCC 43003]|nr:hypothetical protein HMPREF0880_01972 [Yokenella regensburgei ATCC 43003]
MFIPDTTSLGIVYHRGSLAESIHNQQITTRITIFAARLLPR